MPAPRLRPTLVLRNAAVATCDAGPSDAGLLAGAAVAVDERLVGWVGPEVDLERACDLDGARVLDAGGRLVTPGLVDSHTHLVFGDRGERAEEFAARAAGRGYLETSRSGGGIAATVAATRAASDEALLAAAEQRAMRLLSQGVTTVEVKSGYGLSAAEELRLLRVVHELARRLWDRLAVVPTLLAGHAVPAERAGDRAGWIREVAESVVPAAARERLAVFCDAFPEEGALSLDEARAVLGAGKAHGLVPRLHADQLSRVGGAELAAELGCAGADHLEQVDEAGIAALARAGVVAGLLPVSTLFLRLPAFAPGRRLLDAGVPVAVATNVNPGSAMSENPSLALSLACLGNGLTPAEALVAFTAGGAHSLRLPEVGRLAPGMQADLVLWGCRSLEHLAWHMGTSHALLVVKRGRVAHRADPGTAADCAGV
ncbi:MAG TPA: imidazolonepropionase [Anaeromyxobacteraceae bacterium]|nr:imidazolonepropionase [Anaeromyxobacteraceae bacterium]